MRGSYPRSEERRGRQGFTMMEMVVVVAIMAIIMAASAWNFFGMRRGSEMNGAISSLRTTMSLARQRAVTMREKTFVSFYSSNNTFVISNRTGIIGDIYYLPPGIEYYQIPVPPTITFSPSGGGGTMGEVEIEIREKAVTTVRQRIRVSGLTGLSWVP